MIMINNPEKILDRLSQVIAIIPTQYVDALLALHKKLEGKNIWWAIGGDLAEKLKVIKVEPDCIEILTSKKGTKQIFQAVQEYNPEKISFKTWQLPRNAVIDGKEYPVYSRSYYFEFNLNSVKVKVQGDMQYRVGKWDWGDKFEFEPEHVYVIGEKTPIMPLALKFDLYQRLGWVDRAEKVRCAISPRRSPPIR